MGQKDVKLYSQEWHNMARSITIPSSRGESSFSTTVPSGKICFSCLHGHERRKSALTQIKWTFLVYQARLFLGHQSTCPAIRFNPPVSGITSWLMIPSELGRNGTNASRWVLVCDHVVHTYLYVSRELRMWHSLPQNLKKIVLPENKWQDPWGVPNNACSFCYLDLA